MLLEECSEQLLPFTVLILSMALGVMAFILKTDRDMPERGDRVDERSAEDAKPTEALQESSALPVFIREHLSFTLLTGGVILVFIFSSIHNSYMPLILEPMGGSVADAGNVLFLMAIVELPVMFGSEYLLRRFGSRNLMLVSALFISLKAVVILFSSGPGGIYFAQLLHAAGPGLYNVVSVRYVNDVIPARDQVKGQSFFVSAVTIGGIAGSLMGGILLEQTGVRVLLLIGTLLSGAGSAIMAAAISLLRCRR